MSEKEYYEVNIWEEYLIFFQLLGIADKVEEQFSKLYPRFKERTRFNVDITTIAIRNIVELGYKGYEEGYEKERQRAAMRSSSSSSHDYSCSNIESGG